MKKVLIIEDQSDILAEIIRVLNPLEFGEVYEPKYDIVTCMTEEMVKELDIDPGIFDYILVDHDLPNRGNGGRILNWWHSNFEVIGTIKNGKDQKIIAISAVPVNNQRLLDLGANCCINKMEKGWLELLLKEIEG